MKTKLLMESLFRGRNLGIFLIIQAILTLAAPAPTMIFYLSGANLIFYLILVAQSLKSKKFQDAFLSKMKKKNIKELYHLCDKLASETKRHTNASYYKKLTSVISDKEEIYKNYCKSDSSLKQKITEQSLNLIVNYIKLLKNFCIRSRELNFTNISTVTERINQNIRKISFIKDETLRADMKKLVEMDEKLITRVKNEKIDLERIDAKLEYIKSTVNMLKHKMNSSMESEEMYEEIEEAVNQAVALESVLEEKEKNKMRM